MGHNNISSAPGTGLNLDILDLSFNEMKNLPENLSHSTVKSLVLGYNKLTSLEGLPQSLSSLYINNNYITEIPIDIARTLPKYLDIDYNYLPCSNYISTDWGYVKTHCYLNKQYNCSDKSISECEELRDTYGICTPNRNKTACHRYTKSVKEFCEVAPELDIDNCEDIYLEDSCYGDFILKDFVYDCQYDYVYEYRPENASTMLTEVPENVSKLSNLISLKLSGFNLSTLPKSYSNFKHLRALNLTYNRLTDIPETMYGFENLAYIDISYNKLRSLPDDFFSERNLVLFYAHHNYLSNVSEEIFTRLTSATYKNLNYNFLNCYSYEARESCIQGYQYVCSEVDEEGCTPEISKKCTYDKDSRKCISTKDAHDAKVVSIFLIVVLVVIVVVVSFVIICAVCVCCAICRGSSDSKKTTEQINLINNNEEEEEIGKKEEKKTKKQDSKEYRKSSEYVPPPKIAPPPPRAPSPPQHVVPQQSTEKRQNTEILPTVPAKQTEPTYTVSEFTAIARAHMDTTPIFCDPSQPGISNIHGLFTSDEHMQRKDLQVILQQAGCDYNDSQSIIQKIVVWGRDIPCTSTLTTHDIEVLGVYTYNYGDSFRMRSPAFKLCYAMNMQDESGIRTYKDFLYLMLTSLRRVSLTSFKGRKLYFTMTFTNASSANFPTGKMIKIMPFLTLFSNKNAVLSTLNGTKGVIFEVSYAEGYDITQYSIANKSSFNTSEVVMEPESVFKISGYRQISQGIAEVSLMYSRERSEFPLNNVIGNNTVEVSENNVYSPYYDAPSAPSAPSAPYAGASAPFNPYGNY